MCLKVIKQVLVFVTVFNVLAVLVGCDISDGQHIEPAELGVSVKTSVENTAKEIIDTIKANEEELQIDLSELHINTNPYILKPGMSFYQGEFDRSHITNITFSNVAPTEFDESWSANEMDTNDVMGYRVGTKVFIVGEKICLNPSSRMMFCIRNERGTNIWGDLVEVNGLEMIDASTATDMSKMFYNGENFTELNVGGWDVSNVERMTLMFAGCESLEELDVGRWDVGNVVDFSAMFQSKDSNTGNMKLKHLDVSNWDVSSARLMSHMFYGCGELVEIDIGDWDVSNVSDFNHMFADCYKLASIDISNWNSISAQSFDALLNDCRALTVIDVSNLKTGACNKFSQMFESCINLTEIIGLEKWDVSNASKSAFSEMFQNCHKLVDLNLSTWRTSKADNMARMFAGCYSIKTLDLSSFDVSNVWTTNEMFNNCASDLEVVGVNEWNLENVKTEKMFG